MEKIILVYYIQVEDYTPQRAREILLSVIENVTIKDDNFHNIVLPIKNGETRVECVNPRFLPESDFQKYKDQLEKSQEELKNLFLKENN